MDVKTCTTCHEEKPLTDFYKNPEGRHGHQARCKSCVCAKQKVASARPKVIPEQKRCASCKEVKPAREFNHRACVPSGLHPRCRTCQAKYRWSPKSKYRVYRTEAANRDIPFDLSLDEFTAYWQKPCTYCGRAIDTIGIDRIDNTTGYTPDNIASCCSECNYSKRGSSLMQWVAHMKRVLAYLGEHPVGE